MRRKLNSLYNFPSDLLTSSLNPNFDDKKIDFNEYK